jgi:hypothetical protein
MVNGVIAPDPPVHRVSNAFTPTASLALSARMQNPQNNVRHFR